MTLPGQFWFEAIDFFLPGRDYRRDFRHARCLRLDCLGTRVTLASNAATPDVLLERHGLVDATVAA